MCKNCGKRLKENHKCVFKCPVCESTKTTKFNGILRCKKCGFVNDLNYLKKKNENGREIK